MMRKSGLKPPSSASGGSSQPRHLQGRGGISLQTSSHIATLTRSHTGANVASNSTEQPVEGRASHTASSAATVASDATTVSQPKPHMTRSRSHLQGPKIVSSDSTATGKVKGWKQSEM